METASEGFDNGFLYAPEQGGRLCHICTFQHQGMLKLFRMEHPLKGVFSLEFIGPRHIHADLRIISTKGGPDPSSTLAEGNSRPPMLSQKELGLAKRVVDHLNRESSSV